jgi:glycosyltransferase involved in cell wall biosynthesis
MRSNKAPKVFMMDLWAIVPYYTAYLSKALMAEGVDVTVGSITYYLDPTCFTSRGITVDPGLMDIVGRYRLPKLPRRVLKLMEAMINLGALVVRFAASPPDVIHVQYLPMLRWSLPLDFWFLEYCRWRGAKIVLTVHDLLPHDSADKHKRTFHKLYWFVDKMICHSESIRIRLRDEFDVETEKVSVIPHGPFFYDLQGAEVDAAIQRFDLPAGQTIVLWQGIIFPYKGVDLLLTAWQKVEENGSDACLVIAGTGSPDLLDQIREQVEQHSLRNVRLHFRFVSTEELVALYQAADVVVYPYRAITTSGALATGLALGKCIVASDLQVFRETLTDGVNAFLVKAEDMAELSAALLKLIANKQLREDLSQRVREMNFGDRSWLCIAKNTEKIYVSLTSTH